jgi:AcrR family transcriptional regulator
MGVPERREREKELRRELIQEAAKRVFLTKGFMGATIDEIAREAEVSIGSIYLHFAGKEDLYASLNLSTISAFEGAAAQIIAYRDKGAEEKLDLTWQTMHRVFCSDPVGLRGLLHTQVEGSFQLLSPQMMEALNTSGKNALHKLASILEEGMNEGVFVRDDPIVLADALWAMFTGLVIWEEAKRMTDTRKDHLKASLDKAYAVFKKGLKGQT